MDMTGFPKAAELAAIGERAPRWRPNAHPGPAAGEGAANSPMSNDALHSEIFARGCEASGAGVALALALDQLRVREAGRQEERAVLWVQDEAAIRLTGRPYRPGLPESLRRRLIHVAARGAADALFALEEGVRCRDLACVIGEIAGNPRALDFTASRRLSLAAEKHGVPLFLVRLDAARDLSVRRGCAGRCARRPRRRRCGTAPRWARPPGTPSCSAPAITPPENGFFAMNAACSSPRNPPAAPERRIMALWLARLAVDRWRHCANCAPGEGADAHPTALITETAHGPRIDAANAAGRAAGAARGMMLADARTLCPQLRAVPSDPAGDLDFLERLAVWAGRWGPWAALDPPDGLLVDVTAVAHLFGGEARLLADVAARFSGWKAGGTLAARAAIAPTAGAAWALAHFGAARHHPSPKRHDARPLGPPRRRLAP